GDTRRPQLQSTVSALHLEDEFLVSLKQTKPQSPDIMHVQELVHPTVIQLCQYTYTVTTVDESVKQHARTKRESTTGLTDDPIILTMGDL
ncbi:hypothetical protein I314_05199, partial [Cryptococcus bacillisporus CA1873]